MTGKITKVSVEKFARDKGYEPIQIDGIPEGFSFKMAGLTIDGKEYHEGYIAFIPLSDWSSVRASSVEELIKGYKSIK